MRVGGAFSPLWPASLLAAAAGLEAGGATALVASYSILAARERETKNCLF